MVYNPVRPIHYILGAVGLVFAILMIIFRYLSLDTKAEKFMAILVPAITFLVMLIQVKFSKLIVVLSLTAIVHSGGVYRFQL